MPATPDPAWPPPHVWIGASRVLGRDVHTDEPYPHIHGHTAADHTGRLYQLRRYHCAACAAETNHHSRQEGDAYA